MEGFEAIQPCSVRGEYPVADNPTLPAGDGHDVGGIGFACSEFLGPALWDLRSATRVLLSCLRVARSRLPEVG